MKDTLWMHNKLLSRHFKSFVESIIMTKILVSLLFTPLWKKQFLIGIKLEVIEVFQKTYTSSVDRA